ncbi:MAG: hypothetical protein Q4A52_01490 [Bacillota bacterium]|nr:hypothetical protein [Bacillota bacterium]
MDLSQYQMTESGGNGIQFLKNKKTGHRLVLKRCNLEKGLKEVRAYQKMERSALVDFSIEPQGVLLLMHRHHGLSLSEYLESDRLIDRLIEQFDRLLFSSMQALRHIHLEGIVHGRLTPNKLIIDDDFGVQIVGFSDSEPVGVQPEVFEPDGFTAPELVFRVDADPKLADYYSLGRCLRLVIRGREQAVSFESLEMVMALSSAIPATRSEAIRGRLDS